MVAFETDAGKPIVVGTVVDEAAAKAQFMQTLHDPGPDEQATPKRPLSDASDRPKPRRTRQAKEDKSRTTDKPAAPVKDDYTGDAQGLVTAVWSVTASIPYTQPYALIIEASSDALAGALADGAKNNTTIRSFVASGKSSWMLALAGVSLNMGMQAWQMAKDPELQERARAVTVEHLKATLGAKGIEVPESGNEPAAA